jgi:hypothetical protein
MKLKILVKILASGAIGIMALGFASSSWAQHEHSQPDEATQKAFEICKDKRPERVPGERPTHEQMKAFAECVTQNGGTLPAHHRPHGPLKAPNAATKRALEACQDQRPTWTSGQRPTREQFEAFRKCVVSKGGSLPKRPHRFEGHDDAM